MLDESGTYDTFSGEATHTTINILNNAHVCVNIDQTPYELWYRKLPTVKHFRFFGSKYFIKKTNEKLGKFDKVKTKEYFFVIHIEVSDTNFIIRDFEKLLNALML